MIRVAFLASTVTALVGPQHRRPPSARSAEATLGLGCFWEPSETLLKLYGVEATRCGYAGAAFPDAKPDYNSVCGGDGNVEAVRITYDDSVVAYEAVLDAAFAASKPVLGSRQYAPIVFAANDAEAERAAAWVAKGGVRDNGLQRKQFSVEQTATTRSTGRSGAHATRCFLASLPCSTRIRSWTYCPWRRTPPATCSSWGSASSFWGSGSSTRRRRRYDGRGTILTANC